VGYFRQSEGLGNVGVIHNTLEFSLGGYYQWALLHWLSLAAGVNGHMDLVLSKLHVITFSTNIPPSLRFRIAPAFMGTFDLSDNVMLTSGLEMGISIDDNSAFYSGLQLGAGYRF